MNAIRAASILVLAALTCGCTETPSQRVTGPVVNGAAGGAEPQPNASKSDDSEPERVYRSALDAYYGLKGAIDDVKALKLFQQAEQGGHAVAGARAGWMLYRGYGTDANQVEGLKKIESALPSVRQKAEAGDLDAQVLMGALYEKGIAVSKDEKEAFKWLRTAAKQGYAPGMVGLGHCYLEGLGVQKDERMGFAWMKKAADAGLPDAMGTVGGLYYEGIGVDTDRAKGIEWVRKAAEVGDVESIKVLFDLSMVRAVNLGENESKSIVRKAAENGHPKAMFALAAMSIEKSKGVGDPIRFTQEGLMWLQKAAENGDRDAMASLGLEYELGLGRLGKDRSKALMWYRRAAALGHEVALRAVVRIETAIREENR